MKKLLLILAMLAIHGLSANAQTHVLYGTCSSGGTSNNGTIFQADSNGNNIHAVYSFDNTNGSNPDGNLVLAANNKIYGTTQLGGCGDSCVLFEYDPATGTNLDVYDFACDLNGAEPSDGMILSTDGNLYGMTWSGGTYGYGVIYRFNPNTHLFDDLYNFNDTSGARPYGRFLIINNKFYGTTYMGGNHNSGVIFSFDLSSLIYDTLFNFDGAHGSQPSFGSLVLATANKLYGMTYSGGVNETGVIFSYDIANNTYSVLYNFINTLGYYPMGSLIQATDGKLYGMTYSGGLHNGGVIFSYDITDSLYSVLINFDGSNNGSHPYRELMQASNGKLYGTTYSGGLNGVGVAFSYDIITNNFTKLIDFNSAITGGSPSCDIFETVINITEDIPSINDTKLFSVSPNPATTTLTVIAHAPTVIASRQPAEKQSVISIYNIEGKQMLSQPLQQEKTELNISSLDSGIYYIKVNTQQGVEVKKFIKE